MFNLKSTYSMSLETFDQIISDYEMDTGNPEQWSRRQLYDSSRRIIDGVIPDNGYNQYLRSPDANNNLRKEFLKLRNELQDTKSELEKCYYSPDPGEGSLEEKDSFERLNLENQSGGKKYVGGADDNICPICHEDLNETEATIMCNECGQKFHHECIKEWCTTSNGLTHQKGCPLCRDPKICKNNFFNLLNSLDLLYQSHKEYTMSRERTIKTFGKFREMETGENGRGEQKDQIWDWMSDHLIEFAEYFNVPFPNQNNYEQPNESYNRKENMIHLLQEIETTPNWFITPRLSNSKDVEHLSDLYKLMVLNWDEYKRFEEEFPEYSLLGRLLSFEKRNIHNQRNALKQKFEDLQSKIFIYQMILVARNTRTNGQVTIRGGSKASDLDTTNIRLGGKPKKRTYKKKFQKKRTYKKRTYKKKIQKKK